VARKDTILISFRFGSQKWDNIPFLSAVGTVERFLNAEQSEFAVLVSQVNADQWLTSFCAEVLGSAAPPGEAEWSAPRLSLGRARNSYNAGVDQLAMRALGEGIGGFNFVHKRFYDYREALGKGGERAITTIEITSMVVAAVFSAGVSVAGAGLVSGAAYSAALTLTEQLALNASMNVEGLQKKFDVAEIVLQTGASFVSSLISGKLTECFASALARRWIVKAYNLGIPGQYLTFKEIVYWAEQNAIALPLKAKSYQEFMIGFVTSFSADRLLDYATKTAKRYRGTMLSMGKFIEQLATHLIDEFPDLIPPPEKP
jgi:hypothetical protein